MGGFPLSRNFTCVYTHVIFNHVNKVEARYEALSLKVKLSEVQLYPYVRPFINCLFFIC